MKKESIPEIKVIEETNPIQNYQSSINSKKEKEKKQFLKSEPVKIEISKDLAETKKKKAYQNFINEDFGEYIKVKNNQSNI